MIKTNILGAQKLCILITVMLFNTLAAQETVNNPDSALVEMLKQIRGTPLSLDEAVASAMEKSTAVQQARAALLTAKAEYKRELGIFDPELFARWSYTDDQSPTASFFSGANVLETRRTTGQAGIRMDLPFGTELEASLNATRFQTNSSFASLNPQYDASASFSIRQPLLAGFMSSGRKDLSHAEKNLEAAQKYYDQHILDISAEIEKDYWDLYAAERDYAVQQLVRDQAGALLNETNIRFKTGLVGPNEVASARVFLTQQELALYDSQERLDTLSDRFASLIGRRPSDDMTRFIVSDKPAQDFHVGDVDDIVEQSVTKNYRMQAAKTDIEKAAILADAAGWEVLPSLDLIGAIGGKGLTGRGQAIEFGGQTFPGPEGGPLSEAVSQSVKGDYPNWSIGLELSYPIASRSGRGNRDRAKAQVLIAEQNYIAARRELEEKIRSNHRELQNGVKRLQIAADQVDAAQEQVRIGLINFRNGRSTAFELVRLAADFAQAQQRYSQELVRNAKAAASLKQLTSGGYSAIKPTNGGSD